MKKNLKTVTFTPLASPGVTLTKILSKVMGDGLTPKRSKSCTLQNFSKTIFSEKFDRSKTNYNGVGLISAQEKSHRVLVRSFDLYGADYPSYGF